MNRHRYHALLLAASEKPLLVLRSLAEMLDLDTQEVINTRQNGIPIPILGSTEAEFALVLAYTGPRNPIYEYLPTFIVSMTDICIATQCPAGPVGVVLSKRSVYGEKAQAEVRGRSLRFFYTEDHGSPTKAAAAALAAGMKHIAGHTSISGFVSAAGAKFTELIPDEESIDRSAALLTLDIRALTEKNRLSAVKKAIFDSSTQGIVVVDGEGKITDINERAKVYLNCRTKVVTNAYAMNIMPQIDKDVFESAYLQGYPVSNYRVKIGSQQFIVKIEPVMEYDSPVGASLTMTEVEPAQRPRNQENKAGLSAEGRFQDFKYLTESFNYAIKKAKFASYTDDPVLLEGEEGSELEFFAQSIHNESDREKNVYLQIECNAYDAAHIGDLLFGNALITEDGRQTNAVTLAENGTIFLNHIDALPLDLQFSVYLLITGRYTPLHDLRRLKANVRVIAATNRELPQLVRACAFREDLYYALSALSVFIPPIRDRAEDIEDLVRRLLEEYGDKYERHISLSNGCYNVLKRYEWPGNLSEMKSFLKKLVLTAPQRNINEAYVRSLLDDRRENDGLDIRQAPSREETGKKQGEAARIIAALRRNGGNRQRTAEELSISKTTLWRKMQRYGITGDFK